MKTFTIEHLSTLEVAAPSETQHISSENYIHATQITSVQSEFTDEIIKQIDVEFEHTVFLKEVLDSEVAKDFVKSSSTTLKNIFEKYQTVVRDVSLCKEMKNNALNNALRSCVIRDECLAAYIKGISPQCSVSFDEFYTEIGTPILKKGLIFFKDIY
eukprot:GDKK01018641.1.p1 GENE.GDKK01018641.1~~GDKK01018641.1.p1  ORF type:complete len:157 (+),score=24.49 GDKK01018641.1:15-485(+)